MFLELLDSPVNVDLNGVLVQCTHKETGFTVQPWATPPCVVFSVLGVLGDDGNFRQISAPEYVQIVGDDWKEFVNTGVTVEEIKNKGEAIKAAKEQAEPEAPEIAEVPDVPDVVASDEANG